MAGPQMRIDADDFSLFGLPRSFALDEVALAQRWRDLQAQVHPDRFASEGGAAQRLAMQWAVRVNQAYQRLKDPLQRGALLCELAGVDIAAESNTSMPTDFLLQQMAWREALAESPNDTELAALEVQVRAAEADQLAQLSVLLDMQAAPVEAAERVRALMFIQRFRADLRERLDALQD